jgi:threonylcarbamoyladenosine tRNA methylthiotransferase MtaB
MNRDYGRSFLFRLIQELHRKIPKVAIGGDVIVGFPGETEEKFEGTYDLIEALPFSYLHVFPFSKRKGTPASRFPQRVDEAVVRKRAERMRELGKRKRQLFYRQFLHQELKVLVEDRKEKETGRWKGFSRNYIPVFLSLESVSEGNSNWINQECPVMVTELTEKGVVGHLVERPYG